MSSRSASRDLLIFNVAAGMAAIHFMLSTSGTPLERVTWAYIIMWLISLILLAWMRMYGGERGDLVDYDENLKRRHLSLVFGAVAAISILCNLAVSGVSAAGAIYVPQPSLWTMPQTLSRVSAIANDLLYNFVLVANAEENMKLAAMLAIYRKTRNRWLSILLPVGFWAVLHAYQAYTGPYLWIMVLAAFASGLILFKLLEETRSLENAIIAHGVYNSIVVLARLL